MIVCPATAQQTPEAPLRSLNQALQPETRSGKLFFSIGTEYKLALVTNRQADDPFGIHVGDQNSGPALLYSLDYYLSAGWSLSFEHSLRYGHLIGPSTDGLAEGGLSTEQFGWFMDYHGALRYVFHQPNPDREFYLSLGLSFLNRGQTAAYQKPPFGATQNEITDPFIFTYRLGLGYRAKRTHYSLQFYPIGTNHAYPAMSLYIPSFKIKYTLGK